VQSAPATPPPLQGGALALGSLALALATFMNVLDTTIVNVSIPSIAGDLGVAPDQGTWAITSFGVANAISMPLTGWLTQRYGQVRLFTASVLLFVVASFLCGLAPTLGLLILFRVLQGAVAGPMIPLSQSLLLSSYPKSRAGSALAMWSITTLVAPVVGPLLGGWITDNIAWPWIFYINVPVGLAAAAGTWLIYRRRETPTARVPIDGVGLALLVLWVGALQVMLDQGKDLDWFASREIVVLGVTALVALCLFLAWELTDAHPVVDLRLFARRNFWAATAAMALGFGAFFGNLVLLPLWLQRYMGYTATDAGLILAPIGVLAIVLTPAVGKSLGKVDARWLASASFAVQAGVLLMRSHFNTQADFAALVLPTVVQGAAMAAFLIPLIALSLSGLEPGRIPAASGLFNFARISAGSFGTSLATTWWDRRASLHHARLVEHLTPFDPTPAIALAGTPAASGDPASTYALLERTVGAQAAMLSANDVFYASAALFLLLIPLIWLTRPSRSAGAAPLAAAH
jgi:MFS transporter, DHA2 family, multidrug resistance protein